MLVNSNLLNILYAKGGWLEADKLLRAILAWDEEKRLLNSSAIDYLNWANLETLRLHDDHALKLVGQAAEIFKNTANSKGLSECAFVRGRISFFAETSPAARMSAYPWFNDDQKIVCRLFGPPLRGADTPEGTRPVQDARAHPLKKDQIRGPEAAAEKIPQHVSGWTVSRRWPANFPQGKELFLLRVLVHGFRPGRARTCRRDRRDEFLAMHDFFTVNRRSVSAKLDRFRRLCDEKARDRAIFSTTPAWSEITGNGAFPRISSTAFPMSSACRRRSIGWSCRSTKSSGRCSASPIPIFSGNSGRRCCAAPWKPRKIKIYDLQGIKRQFRSQERFFYPFANTKMIRWPISEQLLACLVIGFGDGEFVLPGFFRAPSGNLQEILGPVPEFSAERVPHPGKIEFYRRRIGKDQGNEKADRPGQQGGFFPADHRRKRQRQGTGRPRRPSAQPPRRAGPLSPVNAAAIPETRFWKPSCSATKRGPSAAPPTTASACWKRRTAARFSWTRSPTCPCRCRPSCCGRCRRRRSAAWARTRPSRSTCAWSRPATRT